MWFNSCSYAAESWVIAGYIQQHWRYCQTLSVHSCDLQTHTFHFMRNKCSFNILIWHSFVGAWKKRCLKMLFCIFWLFVVSASCKPFCGLLLLDMCLWCDIFTFAKVKAYCQLDKHLIQMMTMTNFMKHCFILTARSIWQHQMSCIVL